MGRTKRKRKQRKVFAESESGADNLGALYKYLNSFGWHNETSLTARYFESTGRGVCSKSKLIASGENIIRLPIDSLITIEMLEKDDAFKAYFNMKLFDKERRITFQALLSLYILYQKHLNEKSSMQAYLDLLPKKFNTPYFCIIDELQLLPDAILERTVAQNRTIKENYTNICKLIDTTQSCSCCGQAICDIFSLNSFKWSYFVINTRCVYINSNQLFQSISIKQQQQRFFKNLLKDGTNLALAPFLDLFNHSDHVTTNAELLLRNTINDNENKNNKKLYDYILTLLDAPNEPIPCYTQIFISYGSLTNLKLLTEYGFIIENNRHDYFEFTLPDIERFLKEVPPYNACIFHRNKFKFIREHNLHDQLFVHLADGMSHNLRVVLHLLLKESSYFPNILNQVAFGAATQLDDLKDELNSLIQFKIVEYKHFIENLKNLQTLTECGQIAINHMLESVRYLENILKLN